MVRLRQVILGTNGLALSGRRTTLQRLEWDVTTWARATLLVSEAETNLFRHLHEGPNVYTVPNEVDLVNFHPVEELAGSDRTCVFVGALDYRPNIDGAR